MNTKLTVLVTGATGQQGGAVARALLQKGHKVKAMTRRQDCPAAEELKKRGAEIVRADLSDRSSLERACQGVSAMFVVTAPFEQGIDAEIRNGKAAADAAKAAGVRHLLFSSVACADQGTGIPHFDSKQEIEAYIASLNLPYTIVAPAFFMQNIANERMFLPSLRQGKLYIAVSAKRTIPCIDVTDIGQFDALVFERRDEFLGKRIDIASDELTPAQMAQAISRASDRPIEYAQLPIEKVRAMSEDMAKMFEWFERTGMSVNVNDLRGEYPEVHWHTFEQWAAAQDWNSLLGVAQPAAAGARR